MRNSPAVRMDRGNWIAVTLVMAVAVAYMALLFMPTMRLISESHHELDNKLAYVLAAQKSARASAEIQRQLEEVRAYVDKHGDQLLTQEELPSLFSQISRVSKAHNAITTKFEPRPPVSYQSFQKASLTLGVQAEFAAIYGVLRDLETLPMRIWVDELTIRGAGEQGKPVECELHLVVFIDNPTKTD